MKLSYIIFISRFIIFMIAFNVFLVIATASLHELGHFLASEHFGCQYQGLSYMSGMHPSMRIACPTDSQISKITLAGIISTSFIALLLYVLRNPLVRYLSMIIFSLGVIIATTDLFYLGLHFLVIIVLNLASYLIFSLAMIKIILIYFHRANI